VYRRTRSPGGKAGRSAPAGGPRWPACPATGAILLRARLPARTNAPVTIDADYVITAGSVAQSAGQRMFIVAYRLGATGKLPGSAGS
jgi:hypothetical protein